MTIAEMLRALHQSKPLPRAVLDEPALKLRVVEGGKRQRPRKRRRPAPPRV